ncbi:hypothetical protein CYMTET_52393 [Cymbomonas tetramitiformis]|uniref:J domain-containing protein n=1 Tax=Cymbomonas tetramitiformis TaxID=36881 RepID=A0AAE0BKE7_9CHLO|nr:hypothetical protein CYMTET_52393 [Cymbomonas tetramitiformis]
MYRTSPANMRARALFSGTLHQLRAGVPKPPSHTPFQSGFHRRVRYNSYAVMAHPTNASSDSVSEQGPATGYRWSKSEDDSSVERLFDPPVDTEAESAPSDGKKPRGSGGKAKMSGFGGKPKGMGGGKAGGFGGKGAKGPKKAKKGAAGGARLSDSDIISRCEKEFEKRALYQMEQDFAMIEYIVSVRAQQSRGSAGGLCDWLPVAELLLGVQQDNESVGGWDAPATAHKAILNRRADIAAFARRLSKGSGPLEFAFETRDSFSQVVKAIKGTDNVDEGNAYEIMGLDRDATQQQIRAAYRKKAAALHPDANPNGDKEEVDLKFMELKAAYELLRNGRLQKGQMFEDLGGNERNSFSGVLSFSEAEMADADIITCESSTVRIMEERDVTPFLVRNRLLSVKLSSSS